MEVSKHHVDRVGIYMYEDHKVLLLKVAICAHEACPVLPGLFYGRARGVKFLGRGCIVLLLSRYTFGHDSA